MGLGGNLLVVVHLVGLAGEPDSQGAGCRVVAHCGETGTLDGMQLVHVGSWLGSFGLQVEDAERSGDGWPWVAAHGGVAVD